MEIEEEGLIKMKSRFTRICVFCGTSPGKNPSYQLAAVQLGKQLVRHNNLTTQLILILFYSIINFFKLNHVVVFFKIINQTMFVHNHKHNFVSTLKFFHTMYQMRIQVEKKIDLVYGGGSIGLMGLISQVVFDGGRHVLG